AFCLPPRRLLEDLLPPFAEAVGVELRKDGTAELLPGDAAGERLQSLEPFGLPREKMREVVAGEIEGEVRAMPHVHAELRGDEQLAQDVRDLGDRGLVGGLLVLGRRDA